MHLALHVCVHRACVHWQVCPDLSRQVIGALCVSVVSSVCWQINGCVCVHVAEPVWTWVLRQHGSLHGVHVWLKGAGGKDSIGVVVAA
jgi:hypothetical protein